MSKVTSGRHLSVIRTWIQYNALNGDSVIWGSDEPLQLKQALTSKELDGLAEAIKEASLRDMIPIRSSSFSFLKAMELRMGTADPKELEKTPLLFLLQGLLTEVGTLMHKLRRPNIIDAKFACADIANFCTFTFQKLVASPAEHDQLAHMPKLSVYFQALELEQQKELTEEPDAYH